MAIVISTDVKATTIQVSTDVRDRLRRLATKEQTYDDVLRELIGLFETRLLYEREKRILETEEFTPLAEL
jgi:predicted CopG family antitoxin